jgi:hypothetical protein
MEFGKLKEQCHINKLKKKEMGQITIRQIEKKENQEWETVYIAVPKYGKQDFVPINIMETSLELAIEKAKTYVRENPDCPIHINMGKRLKGDVLCAIIE